MGTAHPEQGRQCWLRGHPQRRIHGPWPCSKDRQKERDKKGGIRMPGHKLDPHHRGRPAGTVRHPPGGERPPGEGLLSQHRAGGRDQRPVLLHRICEHHGGPGPHQDGGAGPEVRGGFIRRELGRRVALRHVPELLFKATDSIEYGPTSPGCSTTWSPPAAGARRKAG